MENPCFCIPLRKGVLAIAILDIVVGVLGAGLGVFFIFATIFSPGPTIQNANGNATLPSNFSSTSTISKEDTTLDHETAGGSKIAHSESLIQVLLVLFVVYCLLQVAFGVVLILGLAKDKLMFLKSWLGFRISGAMFTLGTLVAFAFLRDAATIKPSMFDGISLIFSVYCIYVVYVMINEIKSKVSGPTGVKPFKNDPGA